MATSAVAQQAYVWAWLPGATEPIVAGRLRATAGIVDFVYGESYLARTDAVPLFLPELPLERRRIAPLHNLEIAGCISDAGPDRWGKQVIMARLMGSGSRGADPALLGPLTYLLESDSDRFGAIDFQADPHTYRARHGGGTLEEMQEAAARLEAGEPLSPALGDALLHGSSLGGARPKAALVDGARKLIAKFSSTTDPYPVVKAEGVAMELARRVGLQAAATEVIECMGKDVLLVERFDRTEVAGERRMVVSSLTVLGLHEQEARYATYHDLADTIAERFTDPTATLRELFSRIVFNICVGNTDDHARNHAAFWDGHRDRLTLTPAYDICPQPRACEEAAQLMAIGRDGFRRSQFAGCVAAAGIYGLSGAEAQAIVDHQVATIGAQWTDAADAARLTAAQRDQLWGRQILNRFATYEQQ